MIMSKNSFDGLGFVETSAINEGLNRIIAAANTVAPGSGTGGGKVTLKTKVSELPLPTRFTQTPKPDLMKKALPFVLGLGGLAALYLVMKRR